MAIRKLPLILTIDDEEAIRKSFKNYFEDLGYEVIEAVNGKEGLEQFEKEKPDLVLVDLRMSELDGMAVLENVVSKAPDTPVIVASGTGVVADVVEALRCGAWDYILKPVKDMSVLQYSVERALERSMLLCENRLYKEHLEGEVEKQTEELKAASKALGESEEKYRELVQNANSIILKTDVSGKIIFINEFAQILFGYKEDEIIDGNLIGTIVEQVVGSLDNFIHTSKSLEPLQKGHAGFEYQNICKDGTRVWVDWTYKTLFDEGDNLVEVLFVGNNINDRKKTEDERFRLVAIVEQADEAVVVFDPAGKINYINPAVTNLTGFTREEIVEKSILPSDSKYKEELLQAIKNGKGWKGNLPLKAKEGSAGMMSVKISPIKDQQGNLTSFIAVGRDISKELRLEAQLRQTQKMEAIGTLAGGIAHDFNNILSAVIGFTELSQAEVGKESKTYKYLSEVLNAGSRARELVKQILTFSRQSEQESVPLNISSIVKEALKLIRASIPTSIEIRKKIKSDSIVFADSTQIHQIIMNLCVNAGHAMQEQGGILEVSVLDEFLDEDFVSKFSGLAVGDYLCLGVKDTGCGMSMEVQERIYDPFFTTKEKDVGTGMGLSVVHGIVLSYGGEIIVQSEPGKGTEFRIYLPIVEPEECDVVEETEQSGSGTERILFVDDEQVIVDMATMMLEKMGYKVVGKNGSVEALKFFNEHPDDIDLVITDLTMPQMTGFLLAKEIKSLRPSVPVVLCTGYYPEILMDKKKDENGIDAFLMKPISKKKLSEVIRSSLKK